MTTTHLIELLIALCAYSLVYYRIWVLNLQISNLKNDVSLLLLKISKREEIIELDLNDRLNNLQQMKFAPKFNTRVK